jgi:O-acetylhomoserine/O-acetylserine sulfhydrylase-like pyridoxal-dependent enzyme
VCQLGEPSKCGLTCLAVFDRNAYAIALFLEGHRAVSKVTYPGLSSHPQYEIAKRQQHGFGAMITFYCVGNREQSRAILQNVSDFGRRAFDVDRRKLIRSRLHFRIS